MNENVKLSIVVPCYNEAANIPLILKRFGNVVDRADIEVILVNNGSNDHSQDVLDKHLPKYPFARSVYIDINQGYGFGILVGLKSAKGKFVGWTHADMQTDPLDVMKALVILEKYEENERIFVKGRRQGRSVFDNIFTVGMSVFESLYWRTRLWDINAQPNIFPKSFFENWIEPPWDFSFDLFALYMAKRERFKVIRFDVVFPPRVNGVSKWNTGFTSKWKFIMRTLDFSCQLKNRLNRK